MSNASNSDYLARREQLARQLWLYFAPAAATAAAMIAFATLPREFGGLPFTAALVLYALFNFLGRRIPRSAWRPRGWGIVYVVALGVVLVGSLVLEWVVVRRGNTPWLPWILAGVVLVSIASGAWITEGRATATTASAT